MKHHIKVLWKKKIRKKFEIFDIIRGLILLEKCQFFNYDNVAFLWSIKPSLYVGDFQLSYLSPFQRKTNSEEILIL